MQLTHIVILLGLTSCASAMPGLEKDLDDALTDTAVKVVVDKAAMQKDTNVVIKVDVTNKDTPAPPPPPPTGTTYYINP